MCVINKKKKVNSKRKTIYLYILSNNENIYIYTKNIFFNINSFFSTHYRLYPVRDLFSNQDHHSVGAKPGHGHGAKALQRKHLISQL